MDGFFAWLSQPGLSQEICVLVLILILLIFILILVAKYVSIDIKGVKSKGSDNDNKNKNSKSSNSTKENINGLTNTSVTATQDYKILSLIIQAHSNRVRDEMKQYCTRNGLDKKDRDEYMTYVDEKKNLYIVELCDMIRREYVSYDILSESDVFKIIEDNREIIMSKLEKLYIKLRDISICEHAKINEDKFTNFDNYINKFIAWKNCNYEKEDDCKSALSDLMNNYSQSCENIVIEERIVILDKQVQKIDVVKRDLVDILLSKIMESLQEKLSKGV